MGVPDRRLVGTDPGLAGLLRRGPDDIIMKAWQTYLYGISPTMFTRSFSTKQNRGGSHFSRYLSGELKRLAAKPSLEEVLNDIERHRGGRVGFKQAAEDIASERGPSLIVIDASVLANVVGDDGADGKRARAELRTAQDLAALDLVDVETVAVLRKRWLAEAITQRRFASAIGDLENIAIDRYPTLQLMRRAYELRSTVTSYDARTWPLPKSLDVSS